MSLKVYYEDITIETREQIRMWLDQNTMGEQVFDDKPFVSYRSVRPRKTVLGKLYTIRHDKDIQDLYSGTFTVDFSIYEPYGYLTYKSFENTDQDGAENYCGMLKTSEMPASPTIASRSFLIYNPGTQACDTLIRIGGTVGSGGVTIQNMTNGAICKLTSLPSSGYLEIDSFHGAVTHVSGENYKLDFEYHDEGYLTLASYGQKLKNITVLTTAGSNSVTIVSNDTLPNLSGKFIRLNNQWKKITQANGTKLTLAENASNTQRVITTITGMNEITITGTDLNLNKLEFDYYPVIA